MQGLLIIFIRRNYLESKNIFEDISVG